MDELVVIEDVDLDQTADRIDEIVDSIDRGILDGLEAVEAIVNATALYVSFGVDGAEEIDLLVSVARDAVRRVAEHPSVEDRVLTEYFDARIDGVVLGPALQARLEDLLEEFRSRRRSNDAGVDFDLVELCTHGMQSHRLLMSNPPTPEALVRLAHELSVPEALAAAVIPTHHHTHVANQYRGDGVYAIALDLLAHLANDPDPEMSWRGVQALLDVASHVDTCSDAAVRLPIHRLTKDQTERLLSIHEDRVSLFNEIDSVVVPLSLELLRDNRIVRSALWQAYDARNL